MSTDVGTTIDALLACLVDALETSGRPVRTFGQTVGPAVLGPSVCCSDCDECGDHSGSGQLSVYLQRLYPADAATLSQQVRFENCKPGAVAADLTFELARCHPVVQVQGGMFVPPSMDDVSPYADGVDEDIQTLWKTFDCPCDDTDDMRVAIRDTGVASDPQGGCSVIGLRVTVLVTPRALNVDVS